MCERLKLMARTLTRSFVHACIRVFYQGRSLQIISNAIIIIVNGPAVSLAPITGKLNYLLARDSGESHQLGLVGKFLCTPGLGIPLLVNRSMGFVRPASTEINQDTCFTS